MIHHKHENVSNPKNARRHPMVNRWKYQAFVNEHKWMDDGLSVCTWLWGTKNGEHFHRRWIMRPWVVKLIPAFWILRSTCGTINARRYRTYSPLAMRVTYRNNKFIRFKGSVQGENTLFLFNKTDEILYIGMGRLLLHFLVTLNHALKLAIIIGQLGELS